MKELEREWVEYTPERCKELGQRIQAQRLAKGYKLIDVAAELGIGRNRLYHIENGDVDCKVSQLYILAQLLDCSADYLLYGNNEKELLTMEQKDEIENLLKVFNI